MTVLVAGATGTTGSAVVTELVAAGVPVRASTRSADRLGELARPGVDAVVAGYDDPAALRAALAGVTAAYVAVPTTPEQPAQVGTLARLAAEAGAHVVLLSTLGAAAGSPLRFARAHAAAEAAVEAAGPSWTFLRPTGFMQNDLAWAQQVPGGTVAGPVMDAAWSIVDARDVGAVAAAALRDPPRYAGRRLAVTGPAARSPRDRVAALGAVLHRELAAVDLPIPVALDRLRGWGVPEWQVGGLGELYELYASGAAVAVLPDAAEVLGRPGRSWEAFAADHAAAFTGPGAVRPAATETGT